MVMRSVLIGALAIVASLALVATSAAAVSRAQAKETAAAVFFGFISPDENATLPLSIRATVSDVTCGSADVTPVGDGLGFYLLTVVSASEKPGCGSLRSFEDQLAKRGLEIWV